MIGHLSQSLGTNPPDLTLISEHLQQTVEFLNVVKDAQTGIGRRILGPEVTDKLLSSTQKPDASIQNLLKALDTSPGNILLIGDTTHDYEVACQLGADCVLLPAGHQSKQRLVSCGAKVRDSFKDLF